MTVVVASVLGGCALIDQNTFDPHAGDAPVLPKAAVVAVVPKPAGAPPLLVISPGARPADYAGPLRANVAAALARKPDVVFDVVEMQRPDVAAEAVLGAGAARVGEAIVGAGVAPGRVRLDARPDASAVAGEIRVYVR